VTEYQAQVAAVGDETDADERDRRADPEAPPDILDPEERGGHARESRSRSEHEPDGRGGRPVECVDEADLVQEDQQCRKPHELPVGHADPKRALALPREPPEQARRGEVAHRPIGERAETVGDDVAGHGQVQRPEEDGAEQHQIDG
jgi:hypothetical protein